LSWAVVTGASKGIGREISLSLAEVGFDIAGVARTPEPLARLSREVRELSHDCLVYSTDLSDPTEAEALGKRICEEISDIEVLVNNAGAGIGPRELTATTDEEWRKILRLNVIAPYLLTRAIGAAMAARGFGRIINISSPVGAHRVATEVTSAAYASSKGALLGLTRQSARLLGRHGVTVNAILPGDVASDAGTKLLDGLSDDDRAAVYSRIPRGSLVTGQEIGSIVAALCSDSAGGVLGVSLDVNGGAWMR
jgi:NAD(P)-dependent dehydrogenase (short-subunit alcohol dehydrogenase family)